MQYLALMLLGALLTALGLYVRRRRDRPIDLIYLVRLVSTSFGVSAMSALVAFPSFWLFVSFSLNRGRLEDNLPPGFDAASILVALLLGTVFGLILAFAGYLDRLSS